MHIAYIINAVTLSLKQVLFQILYEHAREQIISIQDQICSGIIALLLLPACCMYLIHMLPQIFHLKIASKEFKVKNY